MAFYNGYSGTSYSKPSYAYDSYRYSTRSPLLSMPTSSTYNRTASPSTRKYGIYEPYHSNQSTTSSRKRSPSVDSRNYNNITGIPKNNTQYVASKFKGTGTLSSSSGSTKNSLADRPPSGRTARALPDGPGPLDRYGNKIDYKAKLSSNRSEKTSREPLKATQNYDSRASDSPHSVSSNRNTNLQRPSQTHRSTESINSEHEYNYEIKQDGKRTSWHTMNANNINNSDSLRSDRNSNLPHISSTQNSILNGTSERLSRRDSRESDSDVSPSQRRASSASRYQSSSYGQGRDSVDRLLKSESNKNDSLNNNRGLQGLQNLGNTCYMNCMLQGLANTRLLLEYLEEDRWKREINQSSRMNGSLIKAFSNLVKKMWSSSSSYSSSVSPREFRSELTRYARRFSGYQQQDAQEFLIFLIEGLHEDVNKAPKMPKEMMSDEFDRCSAEVKARESWKWYIKYDNSFMVDLFVGQLKSSLECQVCHYVSNTFDPFWEIPLPLKKRSYKSMDLSECFDEFTREETLDGDERPTCEGCKKRQKCKKKFSIWKFPPILILHLKRFDPMASYPTKLSTSVEFPLENLNLSHFAANLSSSSECIYDLYSVSNHSGTARGGHYTAYTKHPYSEQWHYFNDQSCTSISKTRIVSSEAYVLFYERRSTGMRKHSSNL